MNQGRGKRDSLPVTRRTVLARVAIAVDEDLLVAASERALGGESGGRDATVRLRVLSGCGRRPVAAIERGRGALGKCSRRGQRQHKRRLLGRRELLDDELWEECQVCSRTVEDGDALATCNGSSPLEFITEPRFPTLLLKMLMMLPRGPLRGPLPPLERLTACPVFAAWFAQRFPQKSKPGYLSFLRQN